jgi:TPR repeat protein
MRKLLLCCFVFFALSSGVLAATELNPSDFSLSAEVKDVTPIFGRSCEIEAVIGHVLYGLGNAMGQDCPLGVGVYDHVRGTKNGFEFLVYDTKKQKMVVKRFYIVGEHLLPSPVIKASDALAQHSAPPAAVTSEVAESDQTSTTAQVSGTPKAAKCSLSPAFDQKSIGTLEQQAASGNAAAQCGLGYLYRDGEGGGVPQDYSQAAVWWRKSAEQGVAEAQYELGGLYFDGQGVPQDYSQAAVWYRKAAEQNDAMMAQYKLGLLYFEGQGVPQDYTQAAAWWRKSAEQGDLQAQWSLGLLYLDGQGVPQDYAEAYFWLDLAAARVPVALLPERAKQIAKNRDEAASHLTPPDLSREQERARKWFEAHQEKP